MSTDFTASIEDYLEAIHHLSRERHVARGKDIAKRLSVKPASVSGALHALAERRLVNYEPYGYVTLTPEGIRAAERIVQRHETLSRFFREVLNVEGPTAEANACRIEHAADDALTRRLACFVEFMTSSSAPARRLPGAFRDYCHSQSRSAACTGCAIEINPKPPRKTERP
jgi:DtxR family Mn-dependent transcriptional regulator